MSSTIRALTIFDSASGMHPVLVKTSAADEAVPMQLNIDSAANFFNDDYMNWRTRPHGHARTRPTRHPTTASMS